MTVTKDTVVDGFRSKGKGRSAAEYARAHANFTDWCLENEQPVSPTVEQAMLRYVHSRYPTLRWSYVKNLLTGIASHEKHLGHPDPRTERTKSYLKGLRRELGSNKAKLVDAFEPQHLVAMLAAASTALGSDIRSVPARRAAVALSVLTGLPPFRDESEQDSITGDGPLTAGDLSRSDFLTLPSGSLHLRRGEIDVVLDGEGDPDLVAMIQAALDNDAGSDMPFAVPRSALASIAQRAQDAGIQGPIHAAATWSRLSDVQLFWVLGSFDPHLRARLRNIGYLVVGFTLARRHQDMVEMQVEDIQRSGTVRRLVQRRSKVDPLGARPLIKVLAHQAPERGCVTGAPCHVLCPVRALDDYLALERYAYGRVSGPLWATVYGGQTRAMTKANGAIIIKQLWAAAGLPEDAKVATRSMRAGGATAASRAGASIQDICDLTDHSDPAVAIIYVRKRDPWSHLISLRLSLNGGDGAPDVA